MQPSAFATLRRAEESWWYSGRRQIVTRLLRRWLMPHTSYQILDVGAGYGGMLTCLQEFGDVSAFETDHDASKACEQRGYRQVFMTRTSVESCQYKFNLVGMLDVLEHIDDDVECLRWLRSIMAPDGWLILNVPAFPWLWSEHDETHEHKRRYTAATLRRVVEASGWKIDYLGHWNTILFLPMMMARMVGVTGEGSFNLPKWLNGLLLNMLVMETKIIPLAKLPFGSSLVLLAHR